MKLAERSKSAIVFDITSLCLVRDCCSVGCGEIGIVNVTRVQEGPKEFEDLYLIFTNHDSLETHLAYYLPFISLLNIWTPTL